MRSRYLERLFPGLAAADWDVTSPESDSYNCIAWAAEDEDRWWSPSPGYHWPGSPRDESVAAFVSVFRTLGYEECQSADWEQGFQKVAIFAVAETATHVARQTGGDL